MSEEKGAESLPIRYRLVVSGWFSARYRVTQEEGQLVWQVGDARWFSPDLVIRDASETQLARLERKVRSWSPMRTPSFELLRDDRPSALIEKTWGSGAKPRFRSTLADGSEIQVMREGSGTYRFDTNQQVVGRLKPTSRSARRSEYDLELAARADQVLIVATAVVIAQNRRQDPQTE